MATFNEMKKGFYRVTGGVAGFYAGMVGGGAKAIGKVLEGKSEEALQAFNDTAENTAVAWADWTEENGDSVTATIATGISIASGIKNISDQKNNGGHSNS